MAKTREQLIQDCAADLEISYDKAEELFFTPPSEQKSQGMMISWRTENNKKIAVTYGG